MLLPPIHPGEILREEMEVIHVSANALARDLDVPPNQITEIIHGKRAVTADTAQRLAHYFGTSARFWLNLQMSYDLAIVEQEHGQEISQRAHAKTTRGSKTRPPTIHGKGAGEKQEIKATIEALKRLRANHVLGQVSLRSLIEEGRD
ncbi:MAG: HigA family addiction module antidote protein [Magnetococcales bacterium]|nr:HigA family addiction module antidote protein [Magnetococcales bacterium]